MFVYFVFQVISQRTYTLSLDTNVQTSEFRSSSENVLTEIREENPVQNLETEPLMASEEKLRGKDFQMAILQDNGEEEIAKLQEQLRGKREEVAELERELNDREQDYIKLQRDLCETKEKLNKCESLLTTREWLISREEIEIMREKFLGEGSYGKVFIKADIVDLSLLSKNLSVCLLLENEICLNGKWTLLHGVVIHACYSSSAQLKMKKGPCLLQS